MNYNVKPGALLAYNDSANSLKLLVIKKVKLEQSFGILCYDFLQFKLLNKNYQVQYMLYEKHLKYWKFVGGYDL